ncbi:MAG TPA: redoxin family protein [Labilithrix sp.]|nr:redoxin family protein [Labilithrix sp.]
MVLRRALGLLAVMCPLVTSCAAAPAKSAGAAVPSLTLVDTAGHRTAFPDDLARARLTVVVFYADHCPCFRVHEERIRELVQVYGPQGVKVLVVDSEVSATAAGDAQAAAERGLPAIALDPGAKLADALDAEYATYTVVFDAQGRVRYRGGIDTDKNVLTADTRPFLRDALDALLAGREPRVTEGKALGCALQKR